MKAAGWHRPPVFPPAAVQETDESGRSAVPQRREDIAWGTKSTAMSAESDASAAGAGMAPAGMAPARMPPFVDYFVPELMPGALTGGAGDAGCVPATSSETWPGWEEKSACGSAGSTAADWPGWQVRAAPQDAGLLPQTSDRLAPTPASPHANREPPQLLQRDADAKEKTPRTTPVLLRKATSSTKALDHHATITVEACLPDGVCSGDMVAIVHEGRQYVFAVPYGVRPGGTFTTALQNEGDTATSCTVEITSPDGAQPGDLVRFGYSGQEYEVVVPDGVLPGMKFMAQCAPPSRNFGAPKDSSEMIADPLAMQNDPVNSTGSPAAVPEDEKPEPPILRQRLCPQRRAPAPVAHSQPGAAVLSGGNTKDLSFGVGIQFEYDPSSTTLCVQNIALELEVPFQIGDRLTEVDGTEVCTNPMLAPSLILGARDTPVHLRMIRPAGYVVIEATLQRRLYAEDKAMLVMKGGTKACGIGVVLDVNPSNGFFFVKRVIEGGSAWVAGVRQFDTIVSVDGTALKGMSKEGLPSLIIGPAGTSIVVSHMRAGTSDLNDVRHVRIKRSVDTGRSQFSNAAATLRCHLLDSCKEMITFDVHGFFEAVVFDVAQALVTSMDRVDIPTQDFDGHSFVLCILPATVRASDQRNVEEVVALFLAQVADPNSAMRHMSAVQNIVSAQIETGNTKGGDACKQSHTHTHILHLYANTRASTRKHAPMHAPMHACAYLCSRCVHACMRAHTQSNSGGMAGNKKGGDALAATTTRSSPMLPSMPSLSAFPLSPLVESAQEMHDDSQDSHSSGPANKEGNEKLFVISEDEGESQSVQGSVVCASLHAEDEEETPPTIWAQPSSNPANAGDSNPLAMFDLAQDAESASAHALSLDPADPGEAGTSDDNFCSQTEAPPAEESGLTTKAPVSSPVLPGHTLDASTGDSCRAQETDQEPGLQCPPTVAAEVSGSLAEALEVADVATTVLEHTEAVDVTAQRATVSNDCAEDDNAAILRLLDASLEAFTDTSQEQRELSLDEENIVLAQRLHDMAEGVPDAPSANLMRQALYEAQKLQEGQAPKVQAPAALAGAGTKIQAEQAYERIPIIMQAVGTARAPNMEQHKFLVPARNTTAAVLCRLIRKRTKLPQDACVKMFCDDKILERLLMTCICLWSLPVKRARTYTCIHCCY